MEYTYINLDYLKLMADNDPDMELLMLNMLLEEFPVELEKMEVSLNNNDTAELQRISHKMKSTVAFVGNDDLTSVNQQLEKSCKLGASVGEIEELVERFKALVDQVMPEVVAAQHERQ